MIRLLFQNNNSIKKLIFIILLLPNVALAQSPPHSFKYQAIVRNPSGQAEPNRQVSFMINIIDSCSSSNTVYQSNVLFAMLGTKVSHYVPP